MNVPPVPVPVGIEKVTNSVNGVSKVLVPVPPVKEKNPSVSSGGLPEPIGAIPPESVTLKLPVVNCSVAAVPPPTGVPKMVAGLEPVGQDTAGPKQPVVLPTKDVALAVDAAAIAPLATIESSRLRMVDLQTCPRISEAVNFYLKHNGSLMLNFILLAHSRHADLVKHLYGGETAQVRARVPEQDSITADY